MNKRHYLLLQKTLFVLIVAIIISGVTWIAETTTNVQLPSSDSSVQLYSTQTHDDLQQIYSQAILEAKDSVILVIYSLTDPKVIGALKQKADEGVKVLVVFDGKASRSVENKLGSKVKFVKRFGPSLMHQKLLVIDRKQVWIGSANMTGESLRLHGNLVMGVDLPALAEFVIEKAEDLPDEGFGSSFSHRSFLANGQPLEMWFLPDSRQAPEKIIQIINSAKKTIRVAMFTFTRRDFADALIRAANRGVDVEVVFDYHSGKGASAAIFQKLKTAQIPVFLSQGNALLHYKLLYVDDETLVNGSANWTKAAFTQNDDCFMVLNKVTEVQRAFMGRLWNSIREESQ